MTFLFTHFFRQRFLGMLIGVLSFAVVFAVGMSVYRNIDSSLFDTFPAGWKSLIGLPEGADVAALSYNAFYSTYGALIIGGLGIALGSAIFAGSERDGTIGVILANPVSRTKVVISRTMVFATLFVLSGIAMWISAVTLPYFLNVNVEGLTLVGFTVQLTVGIAFYGFLALAVSGWTGNWALGNGVAAGVMVVSFFGAGLLPVIPGWEEWARIFPWYYLSAGNSLTNGMDTQAVSLMGGSSLAFIGIAVVGVNRRDLKQLSTGGNLIQRLRSQGWTAAIVERFAGGTRVSSLLAKTLSDHQVLFLVSALSIFLVMGVVMGPIYVVMQPTISEFSSSIPENLLIFFGGGDYTTPEGYFQVETFGMMAPIAIMVVTIVMGARAIAGEESAHTMGLLLANPISRGQIIQQHFSALVIFGAGVASATFLGVASANAISGLNMNYLFILATCVNLFLIGVFFGTVALFLGAASGRVGVAVGGAAGAAIGLHVLNSLAEINNSWWGVLSPFHYYLGTDPLTAGFDTQGILILLAATAVVLLLTFPVFARRDLREH